MSYCCPIQLYKYVQYIYCTHGCQLTTGSVCVTVNACCMYGTALPVIGYMEASILL